MQLHGVQFIFGRVNGYSSVDVISRVIRRCLKANKPFVPRQSARARGVWLLQQGEREGSVPAPVPSTASLEEHRAAGLSRIQDFRSVSE